MSEEIILIKMELKAKEEVPKDKLEVANNKQAEDVVVKEIFVDNGDNNVNLNESEMFETIGNIPQLDGLYERRSESMSLKIRYQFKCGICNFSSSHEDLLRRHEHKKHKQKKQKQKN